MGRYKQLDIVLQQEAQKTLEGYWAQYGTSQDGVWAGLHLAIAILRATQEELGLPLEGKLDYSRSLLNAASHWRELCAEQQVEDEEEWDPEGYDPKRLEYSVNADSPSDELERWR